MRTGLIWLKTETNRAGAAFKRVMNIRDQLNARNVVTIRKIVIFLRKTLLHGVLQKFSSATSLFCLFRELDASFFRVTEFVSGECCGPSTWTKFSHSEDGPNMLLRNVRTNTLHYLIINPDDYHFNTGLENLKTFVSLLMLRTSWVA